MHNAHRIKMHEISIRILETCFQRAKNIKKNFNGEYAKSEILSSKQDKNDGIEKREE